MFYTHHEVVTPAVNVRSKHVFI